MGSDLHRHLSVQPRVRHLQIRYCERVTFVSYWETSTTLFFLIWQLSGNTITTNLLFSFFRILTFNYETACRSVFQEFRIKPSLWRDEPGLSRPGKLQPLYPGAKNCDENFLKQREKHLQRLCFFSDTATSACIVIEGDTLSTIFFKRYLQGTEPVSTFHGTTDLLYGTNLEVLEAQSAAGVKGCPSCGLLETVVIGRLFIILST